ncbi:MAG: hypothetical protein HY814_10660 [Candidatus Riflebacteria bacterium]|nr:hypothetical protein [Candidatus Riflebacteria bacterium]
MLAPPQPGARALNGAGLYSPTTAEAIGMTVAGQLALRSSIAALSLCFRPSPGWEELFWDTPAEGIPAGSEPAPLFGFGHCWRDNPKLRRLNDGTTDRYLRSDKYVTLFGGVGAEHSPLGQVRNAPWYLDVTHAVTNVLGQARDNDGVVPRSSGMPWFVTLGPDDRYLAPGADHRAHFHGVHHLAMPSDPEVVVALHGFLSRHRPGNLPPVARVRAPVGVEFPAGGGVTVTRDGSGSYDRDPVQGVTLGYHWVFLGATPGLPAPSLASSGAAVATVTLSQAGTYRFALAVRDGRGGLALEEHIVTARQQGSTDPWRELTSTGVTRRAVGLSWTAALTDQQLRWTADPTKSLDDWNKHDLSAGATTAALVDLSPDVPVYVQLVKRGFFGRDDERVHAARIPAPTHSSASLRKLACATSSGRAGPTGGGGGWRGFLRPARRPTLPSWLTPSCSVPCCFASWWFGPSLPAPSCSP